MVAAAAATPLVAAAAALVVPAAAARAVLELPLLVVAEPARAVPAAWWEGQGVGREGR
jgi:hypothetical protein